MQILVNTDHNIEGHGALARHIEADVRAALDRFDDQITRVEVHLSDENGTKFSKDDKRCRMEARCAGRQPVSVSHDGTSLQEAYDGAAKALQRLLETTLGRAHKHKGAPSIRTDDNPGWMMRLRPNRAMKRALSLDFSGYWQRHA
jgi:ribosome-associated translation inhibitor RaiA